jgi:hypothetical protein
MSELASSIGMPSAVNVEILQSKVYVMNLDSSEFPVTIEAFGVAGTVAPISVTVYANGTANLGTPEDSSKDRRRALVTVAHPTTTSTAPAPLVVDTMVLNSTEPEPPFDVSTQYIRVVIRNIIIPQEDKPILASDG